jgi:hypothetical protein
MFPIGQHTSSENKDASDEIRGVNRESLAIEPTHLCLRIEKAPFKRWIDQPSPTAICAEDKEESYDKNQFINHLTNSSNEKTIPIALNKIPMST